MTALTLYITTNPANTVTTANLLVTTTGAGVTNKNTTIGKNTGYVEVHSQGSGSPSFYSSLPNPSGKGWLWDDATLANSNATLPPGSWTSNIVLETNTGSIVGDIYVRVFKRSSSNVYSEKSTLTLSAQTINTSFTVFSPTHTTTSSSAPFSTGDLLYVDIWVNITSGSGSSTAILKIDAANSSTQGNANAQIVSPGYLPITAVQKDASARLRFSSPTIFLFAQMRLRLASAAASILKDASIRFLLIGKRQKDAAMRLRTQNSIGIMLFAQMRLRTVKVTQKDAAMRFRLSIYSHTALFPSASRRSGKFPPAIRRQTV